MPSTAILYTKDGSKLIAPGRPEQSDYFPIYREHEKALHLSYTSGTKYPIYAYMFHMSNQGTAEQDEIIKFDQVITYMKLYSQSLWSDFYAATRENTEWLRINNFFFEYAFFQNDLYVHWDSENEKYEIYIKLGTSDPNLEDDGKYLNVQTNQTEFFSDPEEDLIKFNLVGRQEDRYSLWFRFTYKHLVREHIRDRQFMIFNKCGYVKGDGINSMTQEDILDMEKELCTLSTCIKKKSRKNLYEFFSEKLIKAADLDLYVTSMYKCFDRDISEIGRVANMNPKQERHTTAEDYIAVDQNVDYKRSVQDQLDLMTNEMSERGWPELKFKVNTNDSLGMVEKPEGGEVSYPKQSV